jgi:hypothetical protein
MAKTDKTVENSIHSTESEIFRSGHEKGRFVDPAKLRTIFKNQRSKSGIQHPLCQKQQEVMELPFH